MNFKACLANIFRTEVGASVSTSEIFFCQRRAAVEEREGEAELDCV